MEPLTLTRRALIGFFGTALAVVALACRVHLAGILALVRRALPGVMVAALALAGLPAAARANELAAAAVPTTTRIVIHDAAETLRDWCRPDLRGTLWLVVPGGARFELVTSTSDPVITNHGDGAFHAFDAAEVRAALTAVHYPLDGVAAEVFILPYPRRAVLASAAGPGLVLLSPGVYPLPREQQHAEFVHELGHVVQYARLPDRDVASWDRYRALRGITDASVYSAGAEHADRPHEIFAEDFRALFGGLLATSTESIENPTLTPPRLVTGLDHFMLELSDRQPGLALSAVPNPARGPVVFACAGARAVPLEVFDLAGRRLATLAPEPVPGGMRWRWDGRDPSGRRAGPGIVFARAHDGAGAAIVRLTLLP